MMSPGALMNFLEFWMGQETPAVSDVALQGEAWEGQHSLWYPEISMFSWKIQTHFTGSSVIQTVAVSEQSLSYRYQAQYWEHHNEAGGWSLFPSHSSEASTASRCCRRVLPPYILSSLLSSLPGIYHVSDLCGAVDQTQAPVQPSAIELHPWFLDEAF